MADVERRRRRVALLERKAADPGCTGPEREALLSKARELRAALLTRDSRPPSDELLAAVRHSTATFTATMGGRLFFGVDQQLFEQQLREYARRGTTSR